MYRNPSRDKSSPSRDQRPAFGWFKGLIYGLFGVTAVAVGVALAAVFAIYMHLQSSLPSVHSLKNYSPPLVSSIYAADGSLMGEYYVERRYLVPLADVPSELILAFLAAEDSRFFEHPGLDLVGISRAMLKNLQAGEIVQGGSTITQQVAKALLLTPERTWSRKLKEAILAYRIDHALNKDEILTIYLNQIYLGEGAYGVEAAARTYFGKGVHDLDLAECALLAGLPQAPSRYSPFKQYDLARERQYHVLKQMAGLGHISPAIMQAAFAEPLRLVPPRRWTLKEQSYFSEQVRREAESRYGHDTLYKQGLQIYTTMEPAAQQMAEAALDRGIRELDKRHGYRGAHQHIAVEKWRDFSRNLTGKNKDLAEKRTAEALITGYDKKAKIFQLDLGSAKAQLPATGSGWGEDRRLPANLKPGDAIWVRLEKLLGKDSAATLWLVSLEQEPQVQGALLALNHQTGAVLCMVGGRDFEQSQFNRAVQAIRQPGSAFKPIIYGAALDRGFTPASILIDSPVSYGDSSLQGRWTPANYDNRFWGPILLRDALIYSRNVVTVKLLQSIGPRQAIEYAKQLGIHSPLTPTLALALGASAVSLWELLTAYSTFANQGARTDPYLIEKVLDRYGRVLTAHQPQPERVISPESAFVMTDILKGVIEEGTGRRARKLGRPAAGKTGTSNDLKDAWFIGYTPSILTGVWVGYDDDDITLGGDETGGHAACPIWLYFMEEYLRDQPIEKFPVPEDIVFARVSARGSGSEQETTGKAVYAAFRKDQLRGDPNTLQNQAASDESGELRSPRGAKQEDPMDAFFKSDLF